MARSPASSDNHGEYLSETSSRSVTDTVKVSHNFEITNYWELDGMGVGECICSSTFTPTTTIGISGSIQTEKQRTTTSAAWSSCVYAEDQG
jgi:hypothetical protein